jgi:hypothetical protein
LRIRFVKATDPVNDYYTITIPNTSLQLGWNHFKLKKSGFAKGPAAVITWDSIQRVYLWAFCDTTGSEVPYVIWDSLRISKADPDNADAYNDTGRSWDFGAATGSDVGEWHIYEGNRSGEPGKPFSLGQIKTVTTPAVWYAAYKPLATTNIVSGTIQAGLYLKGSNGQAALSFFAKDITAASWSMYAIESDSAADVIRLVKWVGGTRTVISTASFSFAPDKILWLGADFRDYDSDGGRIRVYASLSEGNLIQASRMVISTQDTQWLGDAGGSVGLLSYQANVRFVNFVAGSPAHADVADVALALDGPIIGGETRRVRYNKDSNQFEYSDDGSTFAPVGAMTNVAGVAAVRDASGDLVCRLVRPEYNGGTAPSFNFVNVQNAQGVGADNYVRAATLAEAKYRLGLVSAIAEGTAAVDGWVTITGLNLNAYRGLLIIWLGLTKHTGADGIGLRFNYDSGANYVNHHLTGQGAGGVTNGMSAASTYTVLGTMNGVAGANAVWSTGFCFFPLIAAGLQRSHHGISWATQAPYIQVRSGYWSNYTDNISVIQFLAASAPSNNFQAGTRFTLYGLI